MTISFAFSGSMLSEELMQGLSVLAREGHTIHVDEGRGTRFAIAAFCNDPPVKVEWGESQGERHLTPLAVTVPSEWSVVDAFSNLRSRALAESNDKLTLTPQRTVVTVYSIRDQ